MAAGRHLENWTNGHIMATVLPIGTKFSMMIHICPPHRTGSENFKLIKIQDGKWSPS